MIPAEETVPAQVGFPGAAEIQKNYFDLRKEEIISVKSINYWNVFTELYTISL